jgi:serine protease inhibitor
MLSKEIHKYLPFPPKPLFVSPCAPTALKMNCGKLKAKKSPFFAGHFAGKSLENQAKTPQKMLQKCRNFRGYPRCILSRSFRSGIFDSIRNHPALNSQLIRLSTFHPAVDGCRKASHPFPTMKKILGGFLICLAASLALADPPGAPQLAEANNGFAFDLLKQIETGQPTQNIFISPYSVSLALQMLGNGAAGQTKTEMQDVLKTKDFSPDELNAACKELNHSLLSQTNVTLDLADSIWYQKAFTLKSDFVAANKNFFQAQLASVDFGTPAAADIINQWADEKTHGKITGVVSFPFPPLTKVVLANAIYFKGKWADPFNPERTHPRDFHLADGTVKQAPMMWQLKKFAYKVGDGFQAVKLPYAGGRLEMCLFLPAANSTPEKLLAGFSGTNWNDAILSGFSDREGKLFFPKFKLNYDIILNRPLEALGMKQAFDPNAADFSAMAGEPLFVSLVAQKSFVDVNEEGTEAAAVTTIWMTNSLAMPSSPFEMLMDRPFLFVIDDNQTGAILFMGIVNDPTQ